MSAAQSIRGAKPRLVSPFTLLLGEFLSKIIPKRQPPQRIHKILFFKFGALGDVLLTTPLVRAMREQFPYATIDYCLGQWAAPALQNNPHLSSVVTFTDSTNTLKRLVPLLTTLWRLRRADYDVVFVLDRAWQAGLLGTFIGGYTIGFDRLGEGFALDTSIPYGYESHEQAPHDIDTYLALGKHLGCGTANRQMVFQPTAQDRAFAHQLLDQAGWQKKPFAVRPHFATGSAGHGRARERGASRSFSAKAGDRGLSATHRWVGRHVFSGNTALSEHHRGTVALCPGGARNPYQEMAVRRWPAEYYAQLARQLISRGLQVVLLGGHTDRPEADTIVTQCPEVIDCVGRTSLAQAAAIIEQCTAVVAHDTALMHVAAAIGTPTIALFGPTNPRRKELLGPQHTTIWKRLPCPTCGQVVCHWEKVPPHRASHASIQAISVEEVFAAVALSV